MADRLITYTIDVQLDCIFSASASLFSSTKQFARQLEAKKLQLPLKGQCHVAVNKPVISRIYIVAHTWPLCFVQILVDGVNLH